MKRFNPSWLTNRNSKHHACARHFARKKAEARSVMYLISCIAVTLIALLLALGCAR